MRCPAQPDRFHSIVAEGDSTIPNSSFLIPNEETRTESSLSYNDRISFGTHGDVGDAAADLTLHILHVIPGGLG